MSTNSHRKTVLLLAGIAVVFAVLRYFMKGWVEPLGFPTAAGSLLASITLVVFVGLVLLFLKEGRHTQGRYLRAAVWFAALAAWCEAWVIAGILVTERTGADTYYRGPWEVVHRTFPTGAAHALGHTQGFWVRLAVYLVVGAIIYFIAKRWRSKASAAAA